MDKAEKAMEDFVKGLAKLTKKTGISIETVGGLYYDDPKTIDNVEYSDDFYSGDLQVSLSFKDNGKKIKIKSDYYQEVDVDNINYMITLSVSGKVIIQDLARKNLSTGSFYLSKELVDSISFFNISEDIIVEALENNKSEIILG